MSLALYRKYRPQKFEEVIGQNHIKTTLQNELETDRVAHAYLFSGPRGLGKTTIARLFAKSVNCIERKDGQSEPCDKCDSCLEIKEGRSIDVIEIDAASHTGVDNVRENIVSSARFTPTRRKFKVFIIDEVHMLSISAFNALLKTLEEPPSHAIFILATTEIHKIPQTIISRCQRFDFRKVSMPDMVARLVNIVGQEKKKVDKTILENIVYHSGGYVRDAESLLGQILSLDKEKITLEQSQLVIPASRFGLVLDLIDFLVKNNSTAAITLINKLVQEGGDLPRFTGDIVEILRKILLVKIGSQLDEFSAGLIQDFEKKISILAKDSKMEKLMQMINVFIAAKQELKSADIVQLPLEIAIIEICSEPNNDKTDTDDDAGNSDEVKVGDNNDSKKTVRPLLTGIKISKAVIDKPAANKVKEIEIVSPSAIKIKLTLEHLKDKWEDILSKIKEYNNSLACVLRIHKPSAISADGIIEIKFKYKFHQQRINELKNRQLLERVLEDILGTKVQIKTILDESLPDNNLEEIKEQLPVVDPTQNSLLDDVINNFGGQVIE